MSAGTLRRFTRREVLAWIAMTASGAAARQDRRASRSLRLLVHGTLPPSAREGLDFGVREAAATAALMRRELELGTSSAGITGAIGVISADPPDPDAIPEGTPLVMLRHASGDASRCTFRVALGPAEREAALKAWRAAKGSQEKARDLRVVEWHASLFRYGASELNDRFRKETGRGMDADAWLAWFAVKALVESALRDAAGCDGFGRVRFDGHKGRPLSFDPATRLLQQPLYIVSGDRVIDEIM